MKQNSRYILEAILLGAATSALCIVAILSFNAPKRLDNETQGVESYELSDEEYYEDEYYEDEYYDDYSDGEEYYEEEVYEDVPVVDDYENPDEVYQMD